jgi:hypothetical protein
MVPAANVYEHIEDVDRLFNNYDLTVSFDYTSKWDNNAQSMVDLINSECKS